MAVVYFVTVPGLYHCTCLAADTKPLSPPNGATLLESDTGKIYLASGGSWGEVLNAAYSVAAHTHSGVYEPANANIQAHVASAHAPSNAQKNSDITKAEIEAKLTGEISSHTHAGGGGDPSYSPGSFTVVTETARTIPARMKLSGSQRATVEGTGRLVIV